jgi:NitT/TauT family transport system substrate-binding protein
VTVVATPGVADAPLYIGIKDGLFRQAGLTVHLLPGGSVKSEVAALSSGHADVAFGDYADMFYAQEQAKSTHLDIVANGYDAAASTVEILTLPTSTIKTPAQFVPGTIIGTPEPQGMPTTTLRHNAPDSLESVAAWTVLGSDNVDPSKITWRAMPAGTLISALENHSVDAILATQPLIYEAETQAGAVPVLDAATGATANLPLDGYFTSATYYKHNDAVMAAFRAALLRAQADGSQAAQVQTALTQYAHLNPETAALITLGTYPTSLQPLDLQQVATLGYNVGALPSGTFNVSSMIPKS